MVGIAPRTDLIEAHPKMAYIRDLKSSGTGGGTNTGGAVWTNRDLNIVNGDGSLTNAGSSLVTLNVGTKEFTITAAGKYRIKATQVFYGNIAGMSTRIYCAANAAFTIQSNNGSNTAAVSVESELSGTITLTGPTTFTLQYMTGASVSTYGLGMSGSSGIEVYSTIEIEKVR